MSEISKARIKQIEQLLFKFKDIPRLIKLKHTEIKIVSSTYEGIKGKSDNKIMAGSRTNAISSSIENEVLNKEHRIEQLEHEITMLELEQENIEIALEALDDTELDIITDKYFNKMSYAKIGDKHYFSKDWAYYTCQRIIKEKIAEYIIV